MQGTQDAVIIDIRRELGQKVHSYTMHPCKQLIDVSCWLRKKLCLFCLTENVVLNVGNSAFIAVCL